MLAVSAFEHETAIAADGDGVWTTVLTTDWDIGGNANGGYAMMSTLRALREVGGHCDPVSVTTHFLRPVQGGGPGRISTELVRRGRTVSVVRGTLHHDERDRLAVTAAMGDLGVPALADGPVFEPAPPSIPGPDDCVERSGDSQGVDLAIRSRCDMRIPSDRLDGGLDEAVMDGWIRFHDGTEPSSLALPLFADAFPPSLFAKLGRIGWVPTIELTVQVRRRPAPGWIQGRFECDDLVDGRMIETGTLWDSEGHVVARSRQLGLLLSV